MSRFRNSLIFIGALIWSGCASAPPFTEYTVARAAVGAAREFDSAKYATGLWNKAEDFYRRGQKAFRNSDYEEARNFFRLATEYAEKAENLTRLKKSQSGENFE